MVSVITWLWGDKYSFDDVWKLRDGFARGYDLGPDHLSHEFVLVTDRAAGPGFIERAGASPAKIRVVPIPPEDLYLTKMPGCFARLRMFDSVWHARAKLHGKTICCDLDAVVTGSLAPLFEGDSGISFRILAGANAANPCPYNGSLVMFRSPRGETENLWRLFSVEATRRVPYHEFPDDQGWYSYLMPEAATWQAGPESGVYAFQKPGWPKLDLKSGPALGPGSGPGPRPDTRHWSDDLPANARLVVFPGWRSPAKFAHLPWVKEHWR
jgi:hypothetical protein